MKTPARILVVDDTPQNVLLLTDLLASKGYAVATASARLLTSASFPSSW
jgi:CheY-like chemotaxis protein